MAVYVRHAHKAEKLTLDLATARTKGEIASEVVAVTVLDKGGGTWTLTFHFYDGTELELTNAEASNGDRFAWDVDSLFLTNAAQALESLKLLVEFQVASRM